MLRLFVKLFFVCILLISTTLEIKGIGITYSYFFPRNGNFSAPVAPLSIKNIDLFFGNNFAITSSFSLYNIGGMDVKGLPFVTSDPLFYAFQSLNVSIGGKIVLPMDDFEFEIFGGPFTYHNFNQKLNYGTLDRGIALYQDLDIVRSSFEYKSGLGFGWMYGGAITITIKKGIGLYFGGAYYSGQNNLDLKGSYDGGTSNGVFLSETVSYPETKLDYRGFELMLGVKIED